MTPESVASVEDFCTYVERTLGTPYTRVKDKNITKSEAQKLFNRHPTLTWRSLCRVVDWMRARNKRVEVAWKVIPYFRWAWQDGVLPELNWSDHVDEDLEEQISVALTRTVDPKWRKRLIVTQGVEARTKALKEWHEYFNSTQSPSPNPSVQTANTP